MANVPTAIVRALVLWLFVYAVIVAHSYVIWKWQTPDVGTAFDDGPSLVISAAAEAEFNVHQTNEIRLQLDQHLQELDAVSMQLQQASQFSRERNGIWKRTLEQWQHQYDEAVAAALSAAASSTKLVEENDDYAPFVKHLRLALMRTNLLVEEGDEAKSPMSNLPLAELLDMAAEELDALEWTTLQKFIMNETALFPKYRQAIASSSSTTAPCIDHHVPLDNGNDDAAVSAALEAAQHDVIRLFLSQLQNATSNHLPVSFPATVHWLQEILDASLSNATETLAAQIRTKAAAVYRVDDQSPLDPAEGTILAEDHQCGWSNDQDQVLSWLEAGLEALERKRDLRTALLQALADDDIDTSRLILDAELPTSATASSSPSFASSSSSSSSLNLRHVLDTPTLHESAILLDWLLHWINGRHDGLDELLDRYVYSNVADDNESTRIGPLAVEQLLRLAGQVNLPPVVGSRPSKAGILRH